MASGIDVRQDLKVGDKVTGLPISPCGMCEACKMGNPQYCPSTWTEAVGLSLKNPGGFAEYTSCRADLVKKIPDKMSFDLVLPYPNSEYLSHIYHTTRL